MQGDACVGRVSGALKDVRDLDVRSVTIGKVRLRGATIAEAKAACAAIRGAGFALTPRPA